MSSELTGLPTFLNAQGYSNFQCSRVLLGAQSRSNFTGSQAFGDSGAPRAFLEVLVDFGGFGDSGLLWPLGHFGFGELKCGDMDVLAILADWTLLGLFGLVNQNTAIGSFWRFWQILEVLTIWPIGNFQAFWAR